MNGLNNFDKADRDHSLAPYDDLIRFWRSKVKVTAGLSLWCQSHPCQRWGIKVHLAATTAVTGDNYWPGFSFTVWWLEWAGLVPWVGGSPDAFFGVLLKKSITNTEKILYNKSH